MSALFAGLTSEGLGAVLAVITLIHWRKNGSPKSVSWMALFTGILLAAPILGLMGGLTGLGHPGGTGPAAADRRKRVPLLPRGDQGAEAALLADPAGGAALRCVPGLSPAASSATSSTRPPLPASTSSAGSARQREADQTMPGWVGLFLIIVIIWGFADGAAAQTRVETRRVREVLRERVGAEWDRRMQAGAANPKSAWGTVRALVTGGRWLHRAMRGARPGARSPQATSPAVEQRLGADPPRRNARCPRRRPPELAGLPAVEEPAAPRARQPICRVP